MAKDWNGGLVRRTMQDAIYFHYKKNGRWIQRVSPYSWSKPGDEELAQRALKLICRRLKERRPFQNETGTVTLRSFATQWLEGRRDLSSWADSAQHFRDHVFPSIGDLPISDVRPKNLLHLIKDLRVKKATRPGHDAAGNPARVETEKPLAPRTVRNVYSTLSAFFRDAVIEDLIESSPCVLTGAHLPSAKDNDPEWRDTAVFDLSEVAQLIYDSRIPQDRRVCYALMFLGCCRFGEAAALHWRHYEPTQVPLGMLHLVRSYSTRLKIEKDTNTERPRRVPVTAQLAAVLAEWKLSGWPALFGRAPGPDDLIVPSRGQGKRLPTNRSANHMLKKFHEDLEHLIDDEHPQGLRKRRQHDARRTWLSAVLAAGANETHAKWTAHGPPPTVLAAYLTIPWPVICKVVEGMSLPQLEGRVVTLASRR